MGSVVLPSTHCCLAWSVSTDTHIPFSGCERCVWANVLAEINLGPGGRSGGRGLTRGVANDLRVCRCMIWERTART